MLVLSTTQYTVEAAQWAKNNHWNKIRSDRKCISEAVADRECIRAKNYVHSSWRCDSPIIISRPAKWPWRIWVDRHHESSKNWRYDLSQI